MRAVVARQHSHSSAYVVFAALQLLLHASCTAAAASRSWSSYAGKPVTGMCDAAQQAGRAPNGLWGCNGEAWDRAVPLTDFSYAGFGAGEDLIPEPPVSVDVRRDFGATGSGRIDDSAAVLKALKATQASGGVIFFPPGKYILSEQLNISSNLRGAGRDQTVLFFSKSLSEINGWGAKWQAGRENSPYTWAGGLISTQREKDVFPAESTQPLFNVTEPASRGDTRLTVTGVKAAQGKRVDEVFAPGQWLALRMRENKQADLAKSLTNNKGPVGTNIAPMFGNGVVFTHMSRVVAAGDGWVELERPLHADVELAFQPQLVRNVQAKVVGAGIEDLTIEFPHTPYLGHHEEAGWNGVELVAAMNSWIRRVRFVNSDAAIKLYASMFNTVSDIEIRNTAPRRGGMWFGRTNVYQQPDHDGHIGIALHWGSHDNLVERFTVTGLYYHELLVAGYSSHNVFTRGAGTDLCLDHHGAAPHSNLWIDIDVGLGHAAMRWSGDPQHFPYGGVDNVFWSIWASNVSVPLDYVGRLASSRVDVTAARRSAMLYLANRPAREQGYGQVVVDMPLSSEMPAITEAGDWYVRYDPTTRVWPPNLYAAMLDTKATRLAQAPSPVRITEVTSAAARQPRGTASG